MKWVAVLCLVLGVGIGFLAASLMPGMQAPDGGLLAAQAKVKSLEAELHDLRAENEKLARQMDASERILADTERPVVVAPKRKYPVASSAPDSAAIEFGLQQVKSQMKLKVAGLKSRLNLTPEQTAAVERYYEDLADMQMSAARAMVEGKRPDPEELSEKMREMGSEADVLQEILTEEQFEAYEAFQEEERVQQKEMMALHQTNQLSSAIPMSEDQKDQVYAIFYDQDTIRLQDEVATSDDPMQRVTEYQRARLEAVKEKLREVLTEEQIAAWAEQQEAQLKMQEEMMKRMQAGQGGPPPPPME